MSKDKLKKEYKKIYSKIEKIFNKYDLMNIESKYSDEYNYEISQIIPKFTNTKSRDDIYELIVEKFSKSFSVDKSEFEKNEIVKNISKEIWEVRQESFLNQEKS